jgi:hypothetical protein
LSFALAINVEALYLPSDVQDEINNLPSEAFDKHL